MTQPPPPGYPPPPAGAFGAPPVGAYGAPLEGAYGAPPPQMLQRGYVKYPRTPEERRGALACIVWPLAILSTCCAGVYIIGFIPLLLAYMSEERLATPPDQRRRYRQCSIACSTVNVLLATVVFAVFSTLFAEGILGLTRNSTNTTTVLSSNITFIPTTLNPQMNTTTT